MRTKDISDEARLITLVRNNEPGAKQALYERYVRYLVAVCRRYIIDEDEVKDVLQESFLKIFSEIGKIEYRHHWPFLQWMTRIVVTQSLLSMRHHGRIRIHDLGPRVMDMPDEPDIDRIPLEVIQDRIRRLPDMQRAVFNMFVLDEMSHREIASMLGIPENTSASHLRRAKAMLARMLNEYCNEKSS